MEINDTFWMKCSSCKKPISYRTKYWVCNVSTCNRKRTALRFCTVSCWDAHLGMLNHRDSWAEERMSLSKEEWIKALEEEAQPKKRTPRAQTVEVEPEAPKPVSTAPKAILRRKL